MAQQLQNPFAQDYPETIDHTYETTAQRCRFNNVQGPWAGNLLATGGSDGIVEIWDMEMTNGALVRALDGHVKAVESLSWSRNGRYLATSSKDWKVNIWDLSYTPSNMPDRHLQPEAGPSKTAYKPNHPSSDLHYSFILDCPLVNAEFHPQTSRVLLVTSTVNEIALVRLCVKEEDASSSTGNGTHGMDEAEAAQTDRPRKRRKVSRSHEVLYLQPYSREEAIQFARDTARSSESQSTAEGTEPEPEPAQDTEMDEGSGSLHEIDLSLFEEAPSSKQSACTNLSFATFDPSGDRIYAGTRDGMLRVYDARSRWIIWKQQVATSLIKQIAFDRTGRYMVINSSDRAVRVLAITSRTTDVEPGREQEEVLFPITIHPLHRFQDKIGKTPWNTVAFSGDGEYVMGGAGIKTSHHIYVWDRSTGVLIKVLEGPKDALDDCDWSPSRPMIASCTSAGEINIWQTTTNEAWSAFAPGFEELEENREYIEREDEFDLEDENEVNRRKQAEEDQEVDFFTPRLGLGMIDSMAREGDYWRTEWPDEDNDPKFWPHDDLVKLDEEVNPFQGEEEGSER